MKAIILAGGLGTRLSEETYTKPKPMVEIGDRPMIWHIMKIYAAHGITDFIICLGYKGYVVKEYFANYLLHMSDVTFDMVNNNMSIHHKNVEPWKVTLVDTGENTLTGGRLRRIRDYISCDEAFCLTYGDGVSDVDISAQLDFHRKHRKLATVTAVKPPGRFGSLNTSGTKVIKFEEKTNSKNAWINGGFFVLSPKVIDLIEGDATPFEGAPLEIIANKGELRCFKHNGFWQPMDTLRDKNKLEALWSSGQAPWKIW
jgi:glucose-1-phosphate cytidylyltransferase